MSKRLSASGLKTGYLQLPDVKLAYREYGSGPVLILLHGNSSSKEFFSRYQREYFADYRTFALDSRGHGETESDDGPYSIEQYSGDVIRFCEAQGIGQARVIGYSDGGIISLFLARNAPHLFYRIAAVSPNYLVSGMTEGSLRMIRRMIHFSSALHSLGLVKSNVVMRMKMMLDEPGLSDEDLKSIRCDMKIFYAEKDLIREEHIKRMADLIPHAGLQRIDRCSHLTILFKKETVSALRQYLQG